ncbi:hypothetical protein, partial [Klebsiella aerogenes]|uniref:hypothetical protein n=1 Tax=Klebsiella aerogenes TaxID=548 RepID=UPI0019539856
ASESSIALAMGSVILRTMQYFSLEFDQIILTKENIQRLILRSIQKNPLLFQAIFWSRAELE